MIVVLFVALMVLLLGFWLMRGPKLLIAFAYPETPEAAGPPDSAGGVAPDWTN